MANFLTSIKLQFIDAFTPGVNGAKASFAGMKEGLDKINKKSGMLKMAAEMSIATQMTEPLRAGLQSALNVPSQKAGSLENSMAAVNSVLTEQNSIGGDLKRSYNEIEKAALSWSAGTVSGARLATASADEYSKTTYGMISAGLNVNAAVVATGQSLLLAKGTMGDAADAANLLGVMYNNLGDKSADSAQELQRLSDIVAKTQGTFQIANLGQLSEGLKYAIPVAKQFRIETAQLSAVVGQLNTAGLQGSMAGTAFSAMLNKMSEASQKLGFKIAYDPAGGIDVINTLRNIESTMGPLDSLTQNASDALNSAFGTEGVRAISLLGSSLEDLENNYRSVLNSQGETVKMAEAMSDTYGDSLTRLGNVAGVWQTKMGQGANGVKRAFVDMATGALAALSPLLETPLGGFFAKAAGGLAVFTNAGVGALSTGLQLSSQFALIASAASNAGGYMNLFKNSIGLVGNVAKLAGAPIKAMITGTVNLGAIFVAGVPKAFAFAAANMAIIGPVLLVAAAVGAAIAIGVLLYKNWDTIKEKAGTLWGSVKAVFGGGISWLSEKIGSGVDFVLGLLDNKLVQGVLVVIAPFVGIPLAIVKNWDVLKAFFKSLWDGIKDIFRGGVSFVTEKAAKLPLIGKLFDRKDSGAATAETFSAGMNQAAPGAEQAAFNLASGVDAYFPHSDAKKGPLSRLTESGRSLIKTFTSGAEGESFDVGSVFEHKKFGKSAKLGNIFAGEKDTEAGASPVIHINNLTVQSDEIQDALDFVNMLLSAGGVA